MTKKLNVVLVIGLIVVIIGVGVGVTRATGELKDAYVPALTAALVWITAFYAIATAEIMRAANRQATIMLNSQFNAAAPVVTLEANQSNPGFIRVYYLNAGKGPALNFRCWIEDPDHSELRVSDKAILQTIIPVISSPDKRSHDIHIEEYEEYKLGLGYVRAQYESVFGRTYESCLMFPENVSPQLEWGEAREVIRL